MTVITIWLNGTATEYADFDDALLDFSKNEYDHSITYDLDHATGRFTRWRTSEMELFAKEAQADLAAENKHNRSLAAAE